MSHVSSAQSIALLSYKHGVVGSISHVGNVSLWSLVQLPEMQHYQFSFQQSHVIFTFSSFCYPCFLLCAFYGSIDTWFQFSHVEHMCLMGVVTFLFDICYSY